MKRGEPIDEVGVNLVPMLDPGKISQDRRDGHARQAENHQRRRAEIANNSRPEEAELLLNSETPKRTEHRYQQRVEGGMQIGEIDPIPELFVRSEEAYRVQMKELDMPSEWIQDPEY